MDAVVNAYEVTAKWRRNVFNLPSGKAGKHFVQSFTFCFVQYYSGTAFELVALKAAAIMSPLLLQKPLGDQSSKDWSSHLEKRLELWNDGKIEQLVKEGEAIQARLECHHKTSIGALAKQFARRW